LKRDPSIDPTVWDAFLADYFAAAARLIAPFGQVRLTTRFRIESGTKADRDDPYEYEERLTLLRSGPFTRVRHRIDDDEVAILAHLDHSLRAFRKLGAEPGAWTIKEDAEATPLQAYRRALSKIDPNSGNNAFIASHGGAALLEYHPQYFKDLGITIPDLEVTRLITSTDDGHPLLTLKLRSPPEAREADRQALTFVFAVDDSFVVRSMHCELPNQKLVSDCRFEYDHPDGRPVLRSYVTTTAGQVRTIRLDVEDCRFGPIPETESALEPFLAGLEPGPPKRQPEAEPSTATWLDWYWVAFLLGGLHMAGGSAVALGSRRRESP